MRHLIILGIALFSILIGCEEGTSNKINNQKNDAIVSTEKTSNQDEYIIEQTTENGQTLRIFSAYEYVQEYVKKAEKTDELSEQKKLWDNIVMDHIQESCLSGEHSHLVKEYVSTPPKELNKVKDDITILRASEPEKTALEALEKSADALQGQDTTVCILPRGNLDYGGVNVGAGKVSVFYFPQFSKERLKQTVAHEYHHSVWTEKIARNYEWDLLGSIIFEGKAEYFASLLYGEPVVKTYHMDDEQEKQLWNRVKDSLGSTEDDLVNTVLYGDGNEFPYSFGYITGYHIVRDYVENHPETTVEEWTKLTPEVLYDKSGYEESLK
ncbi:MULTISPECIES: DUF2268 domain-containing putative Zn-dependent protease [Halobacillus]|uniref:DUF2268 domain-containing putative Zn-dependent protease n=1 Tax=Halobacillus TaxID=45667 RepID=UPI00136DF327|nr:MULTISPECIES: DUF2268 domain-containing putative Zn-dependent protease [Halobacillus]MYL31281.1 hypothetical protein [Halobacillus halophilus]MYL39600.1 hypothetical protein [Halobacillus litoralis]